MRGHRLAVRAAAGLLAAALLLLMGTQQALAAVGWGDTGEKVRQIQQKLSQWGYYSGAVDGVFGRMCSANKRPKKRIQETVSRSRPDGGQFRLTASFRDGRCP